MEAEEVSSTHQDPRWASIVARDAAKDGEFYYSVKTTGVYCKPSCSSRTARPENVEFYETIAQAEHAGFRPCKRCRPHEPSLARQQVTSIEKICRLIESSQETPTLDELAAQAGLSRYHFHRLFKSVTGLTPKNYAAAHRIKRLRSELSQAGTVTEAIFAAGFNSNSRFYENTNQLLGMTPTHYRTGGASLEIHFAVGECSLGSILVASTNRGVCAILLGDDPNTLLRDLNDRFPKSHLIGGDSEFEELVAKVVGFVEMPITGLDLPLDIRGTAFQQRVWQALQKIPPGTTVTYAQLARKIGLPKAVRAVAQACGANALAVAIPCHRVIRTDGGLSGYRWGVERKKALLNRESAEPALKANHQKLGTDRQTPQGT